MKAIPVLALLATGCTIDLIVGADVDVPDWKGPGFDVPENPDPTLTTDPVNAELCDGVDNDLDGEIDEGDVCLRTEVFDQLVDVDVLLVVDPRVEAEIVRDRMSDAFEALVDPHMATGHTAQFAVLNMGGDPAVRGRLVTDSSGAGYIDSSTNDKSTVLEFLHSTTDSLMATEDVTPRSATKLALDDYRHFSPNLGFDRNETYLSIVYVTTTEDTVEPYVDELLSVIDELEGVNGWSANVIAQLGETDCGGEIALEHYAKTLGDLAVQSGGRRLSHCAVDYATFMSHVSHDAVSRVLRDTYWLEGPPQKATTSVTLTFDGEVDKLDPTEFSLSEEVLTLQRAPIAGTTVTVSYSLDASAKRSR